MRILSTVRDLTPEAYELLSKVHEVVLGDFTRDELLSAIPGFDALLVRIGLPIDGELIKRGAKLKVIATATTGLNHIDLEAAKERNIVILSLRGENEFLDTITSTAELAFGLMIDLMRYTPWAFDSIKDYRLDLEGFRGRSLYGKTLGIVGMGRLGKIAAAGAAGWRMNVLFADPHVTQEAFPQYKKVELDELLRESDVVSLHLHLLPETEGIINREMLGKMKKTACLINTSRGELVDEAAILAALDNGALGGYATDVLASELLLLKEFKDHPLVEYAKKNQNCIIVPHTGGLTHDSRVGTDVFMAQKLVSHLKEQYG